MDESGQTAHKLSAPEKVSEELRAPRAAGVAGLAFAVLFVVSVLLVRPPSGASVQEIAAWYTGGARATLTAVGLYTIPLAGITFLWFIGVVRNRIGRREDRLFATVFLGSGLLFVAMMFAAAATATAMASHASYRGSAAASIEVLQFARALSYAFLYVYAARAAGVFMIVTSTIAARSGSIPRWLVVVGYVIALLLLLSLRSFELIIMLFPAWVALFSIFVLVTPEFAREAGSSG